MGLPVPGSCRTQDLEIYLTDTVGQFTPTSVTAGVTYGVGPGFPAPSSANVGEATLGVSGTMLQTHTTDPTITVQVEDIGHAPAVRVPNITDLIRGVNRALNTDTMNIAQLVRSVGVALNGQSGTPTENYLAVPRFSIKRTNYDPGNDATQIGVNINFANWISGTNLPIYPFTNTASPSEIRRADDSWTLLDKPVLIERYDGTLLLIWVAKGTKAANPTVYALVSYSYAQSDGAGAGWTHFYSAPDLCGALSAGDMKVPLGEEEATFTGCAAFRSGDDCYVALSSNLGSYGARFYVFRLSGLTTTTAALTRVGLTNPYPIVDAQGINSKGFAACGATTHAVVAASLSTWGFGGSPTDQSRNIVINRSSDMQTWGPVNWYRATTLSVASTGSPAKWKIADSAGGLPAVQAGDTITVSGFAGAGGISNTGRMVVTNDPAAPTASAIYVNRTLTTEAAGKVVEVQVGHPARETVSDFAISSSGAELQRGEIVTAMHFNATAPTTTGFAVTSYGRIFQSIDSGRTWAPQLAPSMPTRNDSGTTVRLNAVWSLGIGAAITNTNIAATGSNTFTGTDLPVLESGDWIEVQGFTNAANNGVFQLSSASSASTIAIVGTLAVESAGDSVTVTPLSHAWAAGDDTLVLHTVDGGRTWKAMLGQLDAPTIADDFQDDAYKKWEHPPNADLFGVAFTSRTTGWLCGDQGLVLYYSGKRWIMVQANGAGVGAYRALAVGATNELFVAGDSDVHSALVTNDPPFNAAAARQSRIAVLTNAHTDNPTKAVIDVETLPTGSPSVVALSYVADGTHLFGVDRTGHVYHYTSGARWEQKAALSDCQALSMEAVKSGSTYYAIVGGMRNDGMGMYWRTTDATATPVFSGTTVPTPVYALKWNATESVAVVAGSVFSYRESASDNRAYPSLLALSSGAVLLACANVTRGWIEVFRADSPTAPFYRVFATTVPLASTTILHDPSAPEDGGGQFVAITGEPNTNEWKTVPHPSLFRDDYGHVYVSVGQDGYASTDDGRTWVERTSTQLAIPLGHLPGWTNNSVTFTATHVNQTRQTIAYGGARLFSVVGTSSIIGTCVARNWEDDATGYDATNPDPTRHFLPIIPGTPQWSGVDDVRLIWGGFPCPGDTWTIAPRYAYPTSNLTIPSPSLYWRSKGVGQTVDFVWERSNASIVDVLGAGNFWEVTGFALFGVNFQTVQFGINFRSKADDPDDSEFENFTATSIIASGWATHPYVSSTNVANILVDTTKSWVPHQFKPGLRQYYLRFGVGIYSIVDNDRTSITFTNTTQIVSGGASAWYEVFSDRIVCFPPANDMTNQTLWGTDARFVKQVRVRIPVNTGTPDSYWKIGSIVIGTFTGYQPLQGRETRARLAKGYGWQAVPSTIQQRALSNVASTEHFGRPYQRITLNYEDLRWHDAEGTIDGLIPKLRQPFCLVFDGGDVNTAYLMQLVNGPVVTEQVADIFSYSMELEEVV